MMKDAVFDSGSVGVVTTYISRVVWQEALNSLSLKPPWHSKHTSMSLSIKKVSLVGSVVFAAIAAATASLYAVSLRTYALISAQSLQFEILQGLQYKMPL